MDIYVSPDDIPTTGWVLWQDKRAHCTLGQGGVRAFKREGDGATPSGCFPLRYVLYRADRLPPPATGLSVHAIAPDMGWCDDPSDPAYNRPVRLPFAGHHERMWREDHLYDVLVVVGYNDDPVVVGLGSAIFMHLARPDFAPTEGCIGFQKDQLLALLADCGGSDRVIIESA